MKLKRLLAVLVACTMVAGLATISTITASAEDVYTVDLEKELASILSFDGSGEARGFFLQQAGNPVMDYDGGISISGRQQNHFTLDFIFANFPAGDYTIAISYASESAVRFSVCGVEPDYVIAKFGSTPSVDGVGTVTFDVTVNRNGMVDGGAYNRARLRTGQSGTPAEDNADFTITEITISGANFAAPEYPDDLADLGDIEVPEVAPVEFNEVGFDLDIQPWSFGGAYVSNALLTAGESYKLVFDAVFGSNGGVRVRYADLDEDSNSVNQIPYNADLDDAPDGTEGLTYGQIPAYFLPDDDRTDGSVYTFTVDFVHEPFANDDIITNVICIFGAQGNDDFEVKSIAVFNAAGELVAQLGDAASPEVVAPEVVAPEVVAPEVIAPEVIAPEVVTPTAPAPAPDGSGDVNEKTSVALLSIVPALAATAVAVVTRKRK